MTNDQITVSRELLRKAVDALSDTQTDGESPQWDIEKAAYDALRAALEQPAPVQEPTCKQPLQVYKPTGWMAHKNQYAVPVLFDPYTGEPRDVRDVQSDPQGVLIVPPGKVEVLAAQQPAPPADVPMLTDEEIKDAIRHLYQDETALQMSIDITLHEFRAIEQAVRQKAGLK